MTALPATVEAEDQAAALAGKLLHALRNLPEAFEQLRMFVQPGSRPSDTGSRQRHGDSVRDPLVLAVEDLLSDRVKPGTYPVRIPPEIAGDQVWDPEKDDWVRVRRQGVLPTLSQWARLVDGDLWDSGVEHNEYGLLACCRTCWLAPIRARGDRREGPCSEDPQTHWDRPTVAGECMWLEPHLDWMTEQPWFDDITAEVTRLLGDVQAIIGVEKPEKLVCLNLGCGWPVAERDKGAWFKCTGCQRAWSRLELHKMAERRKPKTLEECAALSGVASRTLLRYKADGRFRSVGRRGSAELYDLDEVMNATLELRYRSRPTRGRRRDA